jgi:hypothetical protein
MPRRELVQEFIDEIKKDESLAVFACELQGKFPAVIDP